MNKWIGIGRLTKDPEVEYTQNTQTPVCRFIIAVDRYSRNKGADFIRITAYGKDAENIKTYMSKGRQLGVEARIQTGSYKNRDGQTVYTTDLIAEHLEFLGGKSEQKNNSEYAEPQSNYLDYNDIF